MSQHDPDLCSSAQASEDDDRQRCEGDDQQRCEGDQHPCCGEPPSGEPDEQAEPTEAHADELSVRSQRIHPLVEWVFVLVVSLGLAILLRTFLIGSFYIPSDSMSPGLAVGDRVLVNRQSYAFGSPSAGDVVVFRSPGALVNPLTADLVKRVVAIGGETVRSDGDRIYVDGAVLEESYLPLGRTTAPFGPVEVPSDHVFVLGDNRPNSRDSRYFGPVPVAEIVGRVFIRYWPFGRFGLM